MGKNQNQPGLTVLGKLVSLAIVVMLFGVGGYVTMQHARQAALPPARPGSASPAAMPAEGLVAPLSETPKISPPAPYTPRDNIVDLELSEYAGYAGLIAANGGLQPSDNSVFAKKYGFKVRIKLSEEESWSALNGGQIAAAATTVDVLPVYGRQFKVVVPAQIGFSRGADGIIVRRDVTRINALKGKLFAASQFTESDFFIRALAQEAGMNINMLPSPGAPADPNAVNLVYCEDAFQAGDYFLKRLKAGDSRLAGCVTWAPKTDEVVAQSGGQARELITNRNLLIVADILVVNRGFAEQNPKMVAGLVAGLFEGNALVRDQPEACLPVIAQAFKWEPAKARAELGKVHLSNLPENMAFFSGAIDSAGSYGGIFQSAIYAYGKGLIPDPPEAERFLDLQHLQALQAAGTYKNEKVAIAPIKKGESGAVENNPVLTRDVRFFFEANSSSLDMTNPDNLRQLGDIKRLLQVSPGSTILLRGHVDNARVAEFRKQGGEGFVREMALKAVELSKQRAEEVKRRAIEKQGVDGKRLETNGRGWEEPVGPNPELNRRVEVQWFTVE